MNRRRENSNLVYFQPDNALHPKIEGRSRICWPGASPRRSRSFCWRARSCCSASTIALPAWIGCGD